MLEADWEHLLEIAFAECEALGQPLNPQQQNILRQSFGRLVQQDLPPTGNGDSAINPLEELLPEQREALLIFIQEQDQLNRSWKAQLLNDWLHGQDSGTVQFLRDSYGLSWLERVRPEHVLAYQAPQRLKVGDRIEVANNLWEWVQEDGPCAREWFPCTVIQFQEATPDGVPERCTVRFDNGMEYEIQGVYDWNRYYWRWMGDAVG